MVSEIEREVDKLADEIMELTKEVQPFFAGRQSLVTSAVLADLTSLWIAGHFDAHGPEATAKLRKTLLENYLKLVEHLIPESERQVLLNRRRRMQ